MQNGGASWWKYSLLGAWSCHRIYNAAQALLAWSRHWRHVSCVISSMLCHCHCFVACLVSLTVLLFTGFVHWADSMSSTSVLPVIVLVLSCTKTVSQTRCVLSFCVKLCQFVVFLWSREYTCKNHLSHFYRVPSVIAGIMYSSSSSCV